MSTNSAMDSLQTVTRCDWAQGEDRLMRDYHDHEWGTPLHDDNQLFELFILESFQAGLSWRTILHKRENFRKAFDGFNAQKMANYGEEKIEELINNPGIIRNKAKIKAAIHNAQLFLRIQKEYGSFQKYIWQFVQHQAIQHHCKTSQDIPTSTKESDEMSKALKSLGFQFVGTTTCYAFMQASGMINDHISTCFKATKKSLKS